MVHLLFAWDLLRFLSFELIEERRPIIDFIRTEPRKLRSGHPTAEEYENATVTYPGGAAVVLYFC